MLQDIVESLYELFHYFGLLSIVLYSLILPFIYLVTMLFGGIRELIGLSILSAIGRFVFAWIVSYCLILAFNVYVKFSLVDLGYFIDHKTCHYELMNFYPIVVLLVSVSGLIYPFADCFSKAITEFRRKLLIFLVFMPFFLMLLYLPFISDEARLVGLKFGFLSSTPAFLISLTIILFKKTNAVSLLLSKILQFLLKPAAS